MKNKLNLCAIIFNDFELLDLFGPLEMFGSLENEIEINLISEHGKEVKSYQGPKVLTNTDFNQDIKPDILLIPGGMGTRIEVKNSKLIKFIGDLSIKSQYVATVCTGSALLAKTQQLNGFKATTNKNAFNWVVSQNNKVQWLRPKPDGLKTINFLHHQASQLE